MREEFISFIWKLQAFNKKQLLTTASERLDIISIGLQNKNAGPDFFNVQLIIGHQKWAGTVELHVNASDWYVHGHEKDMSYDNVILHVVWDNDAPVYRKDNSMIPTLELKSKVNRHVLSRYRALFSGKEKWINCEDGIDRVDRFFIEHWLERLNIERLEQKADSVLALAARTNNDWEAILYRLLLKNFGLKTNGAVFFMLSEVLDFSTIKKERHCLERLEALFFGSVGLLDTTIEDAYFVKLKKEYQYMAAKHQLQKTIAGVKFFRLRPANFPTIRLAQFAGLYYEHHKLFSKLMHAKNLISIYELLAVSASAYWTTHYSFEASSKKSCKRLSKAFIDLLVINTIIPLKFVYQNYSGKPDDRAIIEMMRALRPEKNSIVTKFSDLKIRSDSAFSSQALIQLKTEYCNKKRCLQCAIGNKILTKV